MAKKPKDEKPKDEFEPRPDGWDRFEKAVDKVVKSPPQHRRKPDDKDETKKPGQ